MTNSEVALLAATAVHLGFQLTVTVLVYPTLARVPADRWQQAHAAHSRAITPLVGLVYGGLLATGIWTLVSGLPGIWTLVALVATAVAVLVTAAAAAPAHGRLAAGHDPDRIARLLRADRIRAAAATTAFVAAVLAVW